MGQRNATCAISGLTIPAGTPVYWFLLQQQGLDQGRLLSGVYANAYWHPRTLPLQGRYDGYDGIDQPETAPWLDTALDLLRRDQLTPATAGPVTLKHLWQWLHDGNLTVDENHLIRAYSLAQAAEHRANLERYRGLPDPRGHVAQVLAQAERGELEPEWMRQQYPVEPLHLALALIRADVWEALLYLLADYRVGLRDSAYLRMAAEELVPLADPVDEELGFLWRVVLDNPLLYVLATPSVSLPFAADFSHHLYATLARRGGARDGEALRRAAEFVHVSRVAEQAGHTWHPRVGASEEERFERAVAFHRCLAAIARQAESELLHATWAAEAEDEETYAPFILDGMKFRRLRPEEGPIRAELRYDPIRGPLVETTEEEICQLYLKLGGVIVACLACETDLKADCDVCRNRRCLVGLEGKDGYDVLRRYRDRARELGVTS